VGIDTLIESVLKIGLAPTLVLLVFYFYKHRVDKTIEYLEKQNDYLLKKLVEKEKRDA
jgi:hypothetical protein